MRLDDALIGAVLVIFALAEIAWTRTFPSLHGQSYGPALFPVLIGAGLAICGVALIVGSRARRRSARDVEAAATPAWVEPGYWTRDRRTVLNVVLVPAAVLAYILFADTVGFIPLSFAILSVLLYRLGSSAFVSIGVAVITTTLLQLLFARLLLVPLPAGWLHGVVY